MAISFRLIEDKKIGEKIYFGKHESGLAVIFCPKPEFKEITAKLATDFGSVDDNFKAAGDEDFTVLPGGVAHFLEHKMFEREGGRDLFEEYGKYGASANAYTSFDRTVYEFSATGYFAENLRLLLSFLDRPCFTEESIEKEKGIITQEIRMYDDNADWQSVTMALKAAYSEVSVKEDIAGTAESVASVTEDLLRKANEVFYNPANMVLTVCGNTSVDEISAIVDECVKSKAPVEVERKTPDEPDGVKCGYSSKKLPIAMPQFCILIKNTENVANGTEFVRRDAAMSVLLEILAGTGSSFYKELYNSGLINNEFACGFSSTRAYAASLVSGESDDPMLVFKLFKERIKELLENGISDGEFERVKKAVYGKSLSVFDHSTSIADNMISAYLAGIDIFEQFEIFLSLKKEDLEHELSGFTDDRMTIAVVEPTEKEE